MNVRTRRGFKADLLLGIHDGDCVLYCIVSFVDGVWGWKVRAETVGTMWLLGGAKRCIGVSRLQLAPVTMDDVEERWSRGLNRKLARDLVLYL